MNFLLYILIFLRKNHIHKIYAEYLPTNIDLTKANALNRIPKPNDGDTGRDLYIEPVEEEA